MELSDAVSWAAERRLGVLITIRADGRPQSSDIVYYVDDGTFSISATADRPRPPTCDATPGPCCTSQTRRRGRTYPSTAPSS